MKRKSRVRRKTAPSLICAECSGPLAPEDILAGETTCLECAGLELMAEVDFESPLLAVVRVKLKGLLPK